MANETNIAEDTRSNGNNEEPEKPGRAVWAGKLEFLMSCISVSVGLGNIWRFPFIAYENGGGVFLIPYIIVLFLIGKPMYYMEVLMGQFSSKGPVKMWSLCPAFLGVGFGQAYAAFSVMTYYTSLIAISGYYLVASFSAELPWSYCREEWGPNCVNSTITQTSRNFSEESVTEGKLQSSSELYFINTVLREVDDISEGLGTPSWRLLIALLVAWVFIYAVIIRGIRSLGKAAYFLAIFPYVSLLVLFTRALTLEGSSDGIIFFLKPRWGELLNLNVWKEAVVQCFFSLTVSFSPIITLSSHNVFSHNVHRDAMIVTTLDTFTSLLAGITIFGILGNLAFNLNSSSIDEVVRSGTGLAFISYPDAIAKFNSVPQLFAVLFFIMLFVLGIGTVCTLVNAVATIICDHFKIKKFWLVALCIAFVALAIGLVYITPGGQWILNLVDFFAGTYVVFFLATVEIIGIMWIYGLRNFCDDVEFMTGRKVSLYWRLCWIFFTPVLLAVIFIYTLVIMEPITYANMPYPQSLEAAGWVILAIGCCQFPLWAVWHFSTHTEPTFKQTVRRGVAPSDKWGPSIGDHKSDWLLYKQRLSDERRKERAMRNISEFRQKLYYIIGQSK